MRPHLQVDGVSIREDLPYTLIRGWGSTVFYNVEERASELGLHTVSGKIQVQLLEFPTSDPWSFPATRAVHDSEEGFGGYGTFFPGTFPDTHGMGADAPAAIAVFLFLPVATDLVLLPMTATRDLIVLPG